MLKELRKNNLFLPVIAICLCLLVVSVHLIKISGTGSDEYTRNKQYTDFLAQAVESQFMSLESVEVADVVVFYDEILKQSSLVLSLTSETEISDAEIEAYKDALSKICGETALFVNGEQR